jgi:hypothetical protein
MTGSPAVLVTGYLGGAGQAAVGRLIEAAAGLPWFTQILPVRRQPDGRVIAVAFVSAGDLGEQLMDATAARLGGILSRDIMIAAAWEPEPGRGRQCGWVVRGGGGALRGEVVREGALLPGRALGLGG